MLRRPIEITFLLTIITFAIGATFFVVGGNAIITTLVTITAIDQWHPNWPGNTVAANAIDQTDRILFSVGTVLLLLTFAMVALSDNVPSLRGSRNVVAVPGFARESLGVAALKMYAATDEAVGTRLEYAASLRADLVTGGAFPEDAAAAVDRAKADGASQFEMQEALGHDLHRTGATSTTFEFAKTSEYGADEIRALSGFLYAYGGFRSLRLRRFEGEEGSGIFNKRGLLVIHRGSPRGDSALLALLVAAFGAHYAAERDNSSDWSKLEWADSYLKHTCKREALRGFVPAELVAQVGHAGVATAEELERWAVAQVVEFVGSTTPETVEVTA